MNQFNLILKYSMIPFFACLTLLQLSPAMATGLYTDTNIQSNSAQAQPFSLEEEEAQLFSIPIKKMPQTRKGKLGIYSISDPSQVYEVVDTVQLDNGVMAYQILIGNKHRWIVDDDVILYDSKHKEITSPAIEPKFIQTKEKIALLKEPVSEMESPEFYTASFDDTLQDPLLHKIGGLPLPTSPVILDTQSARPAFARACTEFIQNDRTYGTWGVHIFKQLSSTAHPNLFAQISDLPQHCPKFNSMNEVQKKQFWIYVIAAMAFKESSCNARITAAGKNDTAAGLLQLPMKRTLLNQQQCPNINPLNALDNLTCSLKILDRNVAKNGKLFYNSSAGERGYWQVLQTDRDGDGVRMRMSMYTPCF